MSNEEKINEATNGVKFNKISKDFTKRLDTFHRQSQELYLANRLPKAQYLQLGKLYPKVFKQIMDFTKITKKIK